MPGRPAPVSLTSDLKFLRIGSQIFIRSNQGYIPLKVLDSERDYFEEMASNDDYIAVSTRQTVSREDLYNVQLGDGEVLDFGEFLARQLEERAKSKDQSAISSTAVASIEDSRTKTSRSSLSSNNTSVSSLIVEEKDDIVESLTKFQNDSDLDLQDDSTSEVSWGQNSAETAWSEGSTDHLSGEDEDQWNDWGSDSVGSKDLELEAVTDLDTPHSDGEVASQSSDGSDDGDEISDSSAEHSMQISGVSGLKFLLHRRRQKQQRSRQPHGESSNSSETSYSPSFTSASDSQDDSDYENEDGRRLDELIFGSRARKSDGARRATIRIYNTSSEEPQLIFHFSQLVLRPLFDSAPAFHPSEPLVVWPLGSGEILFANIETNTYFTRQLCFSRQHSCHLSVKTHFSTDGQHLHFAALEAQVTEDTNVKADNRQVLLYLQVSTHRLSLHKTARSPPRLLFRTSVSLGRASSISVSSLPYTFTWTPKELYVTTRGETLNVCRIPLFRQTLDNSVSSICYGQKEIFLPRTAASRNVYYFPPPQGAKRGKEDQATVIIGSHSSIPSQGLVVPKYQASLPIGFYLSENSDLGGWGCRAAPKELGGRKKENRAGGRLQGKFEKFDLTEDCDIVPYLF
jgi:hypothetical protein